MSYRISYLEDIPKYKPEKRYGIVLTILVLSFAFGFGRLLPDYVKDRIFPWQQPHAVEAFCTFQTELRRGTSFGEAFVDYCKVIVEHGLAAD